MRVRANSGSGGGGGSAVYDIRSNLVPLTSYTVQVKNGFVDFCNVLYDIVWISVVVQNGVVTQIHKHGSAQWSYSNGVLTVQNNYTGYGASDYIASYILN